MSEEEVFERLEQQQFEGKPFFNNTYMSGHSVYALLAYGRAKKKEEKMTFHNK
jgi:hypothetical protein